MLHNLDADSSKIINVLNQDPNGVRLTQAQVLYVEYLVSNMKSIGTWQLSNAVYGFVGGTDYKHKWNWKDPRDLDSAFRLTYSGTVIHSNNGMKGNGVNGYANTYLDMSTVNKDNKAFGCYLNTTEATSFNIDMGSIVDVSGSYDGDILAAGQLYQGLIYTVAQVSASNANGVFFTGITSKKGMHIGSRTSLNYSFLLSPQGFKISLLTSSAISNKNMVLMGQNISSTTSPSVVNFSNRTQSFAFIGAGVTDTQAIQQSQIVTNAQMILNRA